MAKKQFRKYKPSQVRAFVIDDEGNLSIDFGDGKKDKYIGTEVLDSSGEPIIEALNNRIKWVGNWVSGEEYIKNNMLLDGSWLGIANKTTSDRLAPQPIGNPSYSFPDTPLWDNNTNTSVVYSGQLYEFTKAGWLREVRVWINEISTSYNYRFFIIDETNPDIPIATVIEEPVLKVNDWTTIALDNIIVREGSKIRFVVDALNSGTSTNISGGWTFLGNINSGAPSVGGWNKRNQNDIVRIHKTDLDTTDRSTELEGVIVNSTISFVQTNNNSNSIEYVVTGEPIDQGDYMEYPVFKIQENGSIQTGEAVTVDIDVPVPQSTNYVELVDHWLTPPDYATVTGFLNFDGSPQSGREDNGYGIDISFQEADVSDDYDIISNSGTSTSSTPGSKLPYNEILITELEDFPTPVGGVITLSQANTLYNISGVIDIGANRIVIGANNVKICGSTALKDGLISTTTGVLFECANFTFFSQDLQIIAATSSKIYEVIGSGSESVQVARISIVAATILGTFSNLKTLSIRDGFYTNFTNGFTLSGTYDAILLKINLAESFTGVLFDLNGSSSDAIDIGENAVTLGVGSTFLDIAPNGANITSGGEGTIFGNKINITAGGTAIVGYDTFEEEWGVSLNDNIKSSDRILPNGWGFYVDGETSPSTQVFNSTPSKLQIDGLGSGTNESHLPNSIKGVDSLWDVTNDLICPITEGDSFDFRINLTITGDSGNPAIFECILDIGGGVSPTIGIVHLDQTLSKTPPYDLVFTFPFFTLATFLANKGQIFFATDSGSVTISSRSVYIARTSSGVT